MGKSGVCGFLGGRLLHRQGTEKQEGSCKGSSRSHAASRGKRCWKGGNAEKAVFKVFKKKAPGAKWRALVYDQKLRYFGKQYRAQQYSVLWLHSEIKGQWEVKREGIKGNCKASRETVTNANISKRCLVPQATGLKYVSPTILVQRRGLGFC